MRTFARIAIFCFSLCLTAALASTALVMAALYGLLMMSGRDLSLNRETFRFWPEFLPPIEVYAWGAPAYLAGGIGALFLLLPLSLALLEKGSLALRAGPTSTV